MKLVGLEQSSAEASHPMNGTEAVIKEINDEGRCQVHTLATEVTCPVPRWLKPGNLYKVAEGCVLEGNWSTT